MGPTRPRVRGEGSGNASPSHGVGTHRILPTVGWRRDPGGTPPHPSLRAFAGARVLGDLAEPGLLAQLRRPPLHLQPLRTRAAGRSHPWRPQHEATTTGSLWAQTPVHLTETIPTLPAPGAPRSPGTVTRTETPAPQRQAGAAPGGRGADAGPGARAPATPRAPMESKRTESRGCLPPPLGKKGTCPAVGRLLATQWDRGGPGRSGRLSGSPARPSPPRGGRSPGPRGVRTGGRTAVSLTWPSGKCEPCSVRRARGGHTAPQARLPHPIRTPSRRLSARIHPWKSVPTSIPCPSPGGSVDFANGYP